ncbi:MAG: ribonuclease P protein component [Tepidiformaceae bacterium]
MDRSQRLGKRDFETLYQKGAALSGPLLALRHLENGDGRTRWGFAVGKRLAKHAVLRNRVRRRLREAARSLPVPAGHDFVLTARQGAVEARQSELRVALEQLLRRAGLLADVAQ